MQLFVRNGGSTSTITVDEDLTVSELHQTVENVEFIPADCQRLVHGTSQLTTGTLSANGLVDGDTVQLLLRIEGGGGGGDSRYKKSTSKFRWKWKKKRTRRLQRKRRKMRQRAR